MVVPIIKTIIYLGLFWGPLFMEAPNYLSSKPGPLSPWPWEVASGHSLLQNPSQAEGAGPFQRAVWFHVGSLLFGIWPARILDMGPFLGDLEVQEVWKGVLSATML